MADKADQDEYFLGHQQAEQARLQGQADLFAAEAAWLFDQLALAPGARVLEMGCGPRGSLDELARRVGDRGQVIGLDSDADTIGLAQTFVAEHDLANLEVRVGDAHSTGLEHGVALPAWDALLTGGYGYMPLFIGAASAYLLALGWIHLLVPRIVAEDELVA